MVLNKGSNMAASILILLVMLQEIQGDQHRYQHSVQGTRRKQRQYHHLRGSHRDELQLQQHTVPQAGRANHQDAEQEKFLFEKYEARRQYMRAKRLEKEITNMNTRRSDMENQEMIERTKKRLDALRDEWEKEKARKQATKNASHKRRLWKRSDPQSSDHSDAQGQEYDIPLTGEVSMRETTNLDPMDFMDHLEELQEMFEQMDNAEIYEALTEVSRIQNEDWKDTISEDMLEDLRKALHLEDRQILERLAMSEKDTVPDVLTELLRKREDKEITNRNLNEAEEGEVQHDIMIEEATPKLEETSMEKKQEPANTSIGSNNRLAQTSVQEERELKNTNTENKDEPYEGVLEKGEPQNLSRENIEEPAETPVEEEKVTPSLRIENKTGGDIERKQETFEDMAASENGRDALELLKMMAPVSNKALVTKSLVLAFVEPPEIAISPSTENEFNTKEEIMQFISLEVEDRKSSHLEKGGGGEEILQSTRAHTEDMHMDDTSRNDAESTIVDQDDDSHFTSELRSYVDAENLLEELRLKTLDLIEKSKERYRAEEASKAIEFMEIIFVSSPGPAAEDKSQIPPPKQETSPAATEWLDDDLRRHEMKQGEDKDDESDVERNGIINLNGAHDSDRDDKGEVATATADTTRLQGDQNIPKPEGDKSEPAVLEAGTWEAARTAMSLPREFHGLPEQAELLLSLVDLRMVRGAENEQELLAEPEARLGCIGGNLCRSCARYSMLYSGYAVCCYKCGVYPLVMPREVDQYACNCIYS
ncbi:uncharacterized protein LOC122244246 isoform X2 [Penaeus japonicus]|uniref:uncharacterized protein LOC122244246 isoform X2 n=1 Tax=Penaeus japonicus TaxID=27405 RepID=UPI001C70C6A3|nr:uncharacterized protein LOC122244246 isoform X2 [Penaeus japonicus]